MINFYYNYLSLILCFQGQQPDERQINCETCPPGHYKNNGASHKTCQICNEDGKVATEEQTKCELCPSVSISLAAT